MKQKARLEIQQNSDDGTTRLQVWQDGELLHTIDGIDAVYTAMEHLMSALREDYIAFHKGEKRPRPRIYIP